MEVCIYCKHCLIVDGMGGAGVCIADHHRTGRYTAKWIVAPEYEHCGDWEDEDEYSRTNR